VFVFLSCPLCQKKIEVDLETEENVECDMCGGMSLLDGQPIANKLIKREYRLDGAQYTSYKLIPVL